MTVPGTQTTEHIEHLARLPDWLPDITEGIGEPDSTWLVSNKSENDRNVGTDVHRL